MKKPTWKELTPGGVVTEPGSTFHAVETGSWRLNRPVIDLNRCTNCFICWLFCPDSSILVTDHKVSGVDYDHCKGCGICAVECPVKCIEMVLDRE